MLTTTKYKDIDNNVGGYLHHNQYVANQNVIVDVLHSWEYHNYISLTSLHGHKLYSYTGDEVPTLEHILRYL